MLVINKEERTDKIYTTYEGGCFEFPAYDSALGVRESLYYDETENKCCATYSQFKKENFISKIRTLAEQNRRKEFSLKYPDLASKIEDTAFRGLFQLELTSLDEDEFDALENEGFEILRDSNCYHYTVKW